MTSRREFLRASSLAAFAAGVPLAGRAYAAGAQLGSTPIDTVPRAGDPALRDLSLRAVDAARSAGAAYADVRLTVTRTQSFLNQQPPIDREAIAAGVRVLVGGTWGFASGPLWSADEMVRLGRDAVSVAKANRWRHAVPVELGERPAPAVGEWKMQVERDPFDVPIDEKLDYIQALSQYGEQVPNISVACNVVFKRQERTFASTDGAMCTQTVYTTLANGSIFFVSYTDPKTGAMTAAMAPSVAPIGAGYEAFRHGKLEEMIPVLAEQARLQIGAEPVLPSRYDVVLDGYAMTPVVSQSIGIALELDRALGLEANAGGTSYLALRDDMSATTLASSALNVTINRSQGGGAATVRWDDDGVVPEETRLVTDGVVTDYQTDRERSAALSSWYKQRGEAPRSHGCAASGSATDIPLVHPGNIQMHAITDGPSFDELISRVNDGIAIKGGFCMMDHQQLTGQGFADVAYLIKKGKLAGQVRQGAGYLMRSPDFWKNLVAVGGSQTLQTRGMSSRKGQPEQETVHTVTAPAVLIKNMAILDVFAAQQASYGRSCTAGEPGFGRVR